MQSIEERIDELFAKTREYEKSRNYYSTYGDRSNIFHVIKCFDVPKDLEEKWMDYFSNLRLTSDMIDHISRKTQSSFDHAKRIISIGDYWLIEEWVLILSMRLDLETLKDLFAYKGAPFPSIDLNGLCEDMKIASQTPKNKRNFEYSVGLIKKNCALPFLDVWYESGKESEKCKYPLGDKLYE